PHTVPLFNVTLAISSGVMVNSYLFSIYPNPMPTLSAICYTLRARTKGKNMNQLPLIDRIVAEVSARLPAGVEELKQDVERNVHAVLQEALTKFDLVSREEFEVQRQVLLRTRKKLETLERLVAELEAQRQQ